MWRLTLISVLSCICLPVEAQYSDGDEAILGLLQAFDPEDVSQVETEHLSGYLARPLHINQVSLSVLRSCGLMSGYQAASLFDYRLRHGDILSIAELAAVDGFGTTFADAVAPFISLSSRNLPGSAADSLPSVRSDAVFRTALKVAGAAPSASFDLTYGIKARIYVGNVFSASFSASKPYSSRSSSPEHFSGHMMWTPARKPVRIIIGDFNLRFGQGLALWNGMNMSGMSSMSSFIRSPTGISPSWSFTGSSSYTGAAADISFGRFSLSLVSAAPGLKQMKEYMSNPALMPAANLSWNGLHCHLGLTHYAVFSGSGSSFPSSIPDMKSSFDIALCIRGVDIVAEAAYDWVNSSAASLCAMRFPITDDIRTAVSLRIYPPAYDPSESGASSSGSTDSNEYALSVLGQIYAGRYVRIKGKEGFGSDVRRHVIVCSADAAYFPVPKGDAVRSFQLNVKLNHEFMVSPSLRLKMRVSERFRTWGRHFRTDLRADFSWLSKFLTVNMRMNVLCSVNTGLLAYAEGLHAGRKVSVSLRQGVFRIDDWEDRIYVHERDAPGSFNVPAMYGRGVWTSISLSWRFSRWGRLYLRSSMTSYPFMSDEKKKPGKAELKFQFQVSF